MAEGVVGQVLPEELQEADAKKRICVSGGLSSFNGVKRMRIMGLRQAKCPQWQSFQGLAKSPYFQVLCSLPQARADFSGCNSPCINEWRNPRSRHLSDLCSH